MVIGQGQGHALIGLDFAVHHLDAGGGGADAQNTGLGRIDDGSEALDTHGADVGNGEGSAGQIVGVDLAFAGFLSQLLGGFGDLLQGHLVGVEDGGNHQAALGIACEAEVYALEVLHGLAVVDQMSVQSLVLDVLQSACNSIHDDVVQGDLVHAHAFAVFLEALAQSQNLGSVEADGVGQLCHGGQRSHHGTGDNLAHIGHGLGVAVVHGLAQLNCGSSNCSSGSSSLSGLGFQIGQSDLAADAGAVDAAGVGACSSLADQLACVDQSLHVTLDNAAFGAGGLYKGQIGAALLGQSLGTGRDLHVAGNNNGLSQLFSRSGFCGGLGGSSFLSGSGLSGAGAFGTELVHRLAGVADNANVQQAGDVVAFLKENLEESTGVLGFLIESGLVGLVGEQDLACGDGVALLLVPLGDDTAFNCITLTGHNDCNCHIYPPVFAYVYHTRNYP